MTTRFADHLISGDHASRPAFGDVPEGTLYSCTDHDLIYQSDGATWATYATLGGVGVVDAVDVVYDPAATLTPLVATDAQAAIDELEAIVDGLSGGGGVSWTQNINDSGASFANYTAHTGTWSSNGTEIIQTDTSNTIRRVRHSTIPPLGFGFILEAEIKIVTEGAGGFYRAGFVIQDTSSNDNGVSIFVDSGTDLVEIDRDNGVAGGTIAFTFNTATFYKVRVVQAGMWFSWYIDGTLIGGMPLGGGAAAAGYDGNAYVFGLMSYGASVQFKNIKVWTLSGGAPA